MGNYPIELAELRTRLSIDCCSQLSKDPVCCVSSKKILPNNGVQARIYLCLNKSSCSFIQHAKPLLPVSGRWYKIIIFDGGQMSQLFCFFLSWNNMIQIFSQLQRKYLSSQPPIKIYGFKVLLLRIIPYICLSFFTPAPFSVFSLKFDTKNKKTMTLILQQQKKRK